MQQLGWKENADIFRLLPVINQYPLSEIIIHPRTGLQRYEGPVDPFLPGCITTGADDIPDKIYRMQRFHDALFEAYNGVLYGHSHVLNKMKGLWRYFSLPFEDCRKTMKKNRKNAPTGSVHRHRAGKFVFRYGSAIAPAEGRSFGLKCFFSGDMQVRFSLAAPDDLDITIYVFGELVFVFVLVVLCKKLEQPCFNFFPFVLFH